MRQTSRMNRRSFIAATGVTGVCAMVGGQVSAAVSSNGDAPGKQVTPAEDLMFEHGVIERLLLIYDEAARRIESDQQMRGRAIRDAARILRDFSERYHEKLEEQYVFPRLEQAGRDVGLTRILRQQHIAGGQITAMLLEMSEVDMLADSQRVARALRSFSRMYLAHIAHENAVAFRTFHELVAPPKYAALGAEFAEREKSLFGEDGFRTIAAQVSDIEKDLDIASLDHFTSRMETR